MGVEVLLLEELLHLTQILNQQEDLEEVEQAEQEQNLVVLELQIQVAVEEQVVEEYQEALVLQMEQPAVQES